MYAKIEKSQVTQYPYTRSDLLRDHPLTTFPDPLTDAVLVDFGMALVAGSEPPAYDGLTHALSEGTPALVDGTWVQQWTVSPLPEEQAAGNVRSERNLRLADCDWTQLPDAPLSAEQRGAWSEYRKALRDITQQPAFPWSVQWPTQPE